MRRIFLYSFFLLLICSCARTTRSGREKLEEKGEPYDLFAFQRSFPDRDFDWQGWRKTLVRTRKEFAVQERGVSDCTGSSANWTLQGPANVAGRVNTLAIKPDDENTVLAGFSGGGIFKTTDGGANWHPVFDDNPELSIGHIAFDPGNPSVVYAGTGDPNIPSIVFNGDGIYKSTDAGETWQHLGLSQQGIISKIRIDPTNPQVIYAATMGNPYVRNNERGVYKSTDGGLHWQQVLLVSNQAGASDLVINAANPQILYASFWDRIRSNVESVVYGPHARVYKTTDGGATWTQLGGGLPTGVMGRTGLAISQQNPDKVYAIFIDSLSTPGGLYKTTDGGASWNSLDISALEDKCSDFGWYFGKICLNPANDDDIFFHAIILWRKMAGVNNWSIASGGHADSHDLVFSPSGRRYWANDGGVYRNDPGQSGWTKCNNLPTTQFYHTNYNPHQPGTYFGGAQDNGIVKGNGTGINNWVSVFPADGFRSAFHPNDPNTFWIEIQNGNILKTATNGDSWTFGQPCLGTTDRCNWDTPFFLSSFNPEKLYAATYRVYFSSNGTSWGAISGDLTDGIVYEPRFHTISCLAESPVLEDKLFAGTSDGNVWRREPTTNWIKITAGLPDRYVTSIHGSPTLASRIFVTHSGFRDNEIIPHIHRSDNNGQTWTNISGDLPQLPVNDLFVLPGHADSVLFAGTDAGVYFSLNSGGNWARLGANQPFIPVFDLEHNIGKNELVAATFARGIWSFPLDSTFVQQNQVTVSVGGNIQTEGSDGVGNVQVNSQTSAGDGSYTIPGVPGCQPYTLTPYRNDFPLNGVSTYDLVLISKHILGLEALGSPYKIIAADANKSKSVTTFDIVALRKLILGIDTAFVNNTSWRFVPGDFVFPDPSDPFQTDFPEQISVQLQATPVTGSDFTAIKIGDVNNSAIPALAPLPLDRIAGEWPIYLQNLDFEAGDRVIAEFSGALHTLAGVQFSLLFDTEYLAFERIEPLASGLDAGNFSAHAAAGGLLTASFENPLMFQKVLHWQQNETALPLFRVVLKAKTRGNLAGHVFLREVPTPALAFLSDGSVLKPVLSSFESAAEAGVYTWPVPFGRTGLWMGITADPGESQVIRIFDNRGNLVVEKSCTGAETARTLFFPAESFPGAGTYYYRVTGKTERSGKLIHID